MNNYEFLISEREHGKFNEYMRRGLLSTKFFLWLEVYQYHLEHPNASTWYIANYFKIDQRQIRRIYKYMGE